MSTQDSTHLRTRILEEAARLFVDHGYNGISMREIAEAVGVSKAALYYHFSDKEALFLAILTESLGRIEQVVQRAVSAGPGVRAQLDALVRGILAEPSGQRAIIRLAGHEITHLGPNARAEFGLRYQAQFIGQVTALLGAGVVQGELRPIDPHTLTWLLLGMLYPFLGQGGNAPLETIVGALLDVFFDGAGSG